jgi:hypothetical protein
VNAAQLLETKNVSYLNLRTVAEAAGVQPGVATYLVLVSDYVQGYRGTGLDLPVLVRSTARSGGDQIIFRKGFLRLPIVPLSLALYARELTKFLGNGNLCGVLRLSSLRAWLRSPHWS